jgi:hypothetical protein
MVEAYEKARLFTAGANPAAYERLFPASNPKYLGRVFNRHLALNAGKAKEAPQLMGAMDAEEISRRARLFDGLQAIATKHGLKLNNTTGQKINPWRLAFILGSAEEENKERRNYKFGTPEVGDENGVPVSATVPDGTSYAAVDAFMNEIHLAYLDNKKFHSIFIDSHGGPCGWIGSYIKEGETYKFPVEFNIFLEMTPDRIAEHAPFYRHTEYLRFSGCEIFGNLTAKQIGYLRNLARGYQVRIEANTTDGWRSWDRDDNGSRYWIKNPNGRGGRWVKGGPGGNAYAFMP